MDTRLDTKQTCPVYVTFFDPNGNRRVICCKMSCHSLIHVKIWMMGADGYCETVSGMYLLRCYIANWTQKTYTQLVLHIDENYSYDIYRIDNLSIHDLYQENIVENMKTKNTDLWLGLCYFSRFFWQKAWLPKCDEQVNITIGFNVDNVYYCYIQNGNYHSGKFKCVFMQNTFCKTWKTLPRYISMWRIQKYRYENRWTNIYLGDIGSIDM